MASDPQTQGEKVDYCGLSSCENRKACDIEGGTMSGGRLRSEIFHNNEANNEGKSILGAACSKIPLKIETPKENPPINPKYSPQTPIVLNKLPIFEENEPSHL